jgi:hypothetical protein
MDKTDRVHPEHIHYISVIQLVRKHQHFSANPDLIKVSFNPIIHFSWCVPVIHCSHQRQYDWYHWWILHWIVTIMSWIRFWWSWCVVVSVSILNRIHRNTGLHFRTRQMYKRKVDQITIFKRALLRQKKSQDQNPWEFKVKITELNVMFHVLPAHIN